MQRQAINVLLIDDQAIIGESIRLLLQSATYIAFHHCTDPTRAFEEVSRLRPDVILQDLVMPEVDGLDLLSQLKRDPATRDVPVLVLSTREEPRTKAEAFRLGANDYMVKLPSEIELLARIRYHADAFRNARQRVLAMQALAESREQLRLSHAEVERQAQELERRNRFIQKTFGRYLSDEVVDQLLDDPDGLRLGGELRVVTVMMADLRGFTSTAAGLEPPVLMRMLNDFLGAMTEVILAHHGIIDEFIGDAILAVFGAPHTRLDDADRAMRCALKMQEALSKVNLNNRVKGLPLLSMGIALHTGEVVVGNIGSDMRAKYGVVGGNVNLTARIESATVGGQVLISEATRQHATQALRLGERLAFAAKGIAQDVVAWELRGIGESTATGGSGDEAVMHGCRSPLRVAVRRVESKQLGAAVHEGWVTSVSEQGAVMLIAGAFPAGTELHLHWLGASGHLAHETAVKVRAQDDQGLTVRFGVAQPGLIDWLRAEQLI
ncbi:MAG: adenylate/guanylate cyclase domain-containing protein [Rubrivivax sp.]